MTCPIALTTRRLTITAVLLLGAIGACGVAEDSSPDAQPPRPEHPRPQLRRDDWVNLNGPWQFRFDADDRGLDEHWPRDARRLPRRIVVPFCWQSRRSGIADTSGQQIGWYRRDVTVPADWRGRRVWLCFGAVDHDARVWVDGEPVGRHEGGYTPFAFDITDHVSPGGSAQIDVRVHDATSGEVPLGLQGPPWFTPTSGIWQTVWLEARAPSHVDQLRLTPEHPPGLWAITVELELVGPDGPVDVSLRSASARKGGQAPYNLHQDWARDTTSGSQSPFSVRKGGQAPCNLHQDWARDTTSGSQSPFSDRLSEHDDVHEHQATVKLTDGHARFRTMLQVDNPRLWTPGDPHLYPIQITVTDRHGRCDKVHSYFALRTIARGEYDQRPHELILLNGDPIYLCGVLDPGFYPEGVYTAPNDARLREDIAAAKRLGFNLLRPHVKAVDPRKLYWADRLGMLVWPEMPNTRSTSEAARRAWEATMRDVIVRDRNHPSIIGWTLFHDSWGLGSWGLGSSGLGGERLKSDKAMQAWVRRMWELVRHDLDPTRLVEDNATSTGDHVVTDLNSWQCHIDDYWIARQHIDRFLSTVRPGSPTNYVPGRKQGTAPVICSQFGALGSDGGQCDVSWSFRYLVTQLRRHGLIQGMCYASLYDVDWRHNGMLTADRVEKPFGYGAFADDMTTADLLGQDFIGCDLPPLIEAVPGEQVAVPVFVCHYSDAPGPPIIRWQVHGTDDFGRPVTTAPEQRTGTWKAYGPMYQPPLRVKLPDKVAMVGAVQVELLDRHERRLATNYVNLVVDRMLVDGESLAHDAISGSAVRVEVLGPRLVAVRFAPREFSRFRTDRLGWDWLDTEGKFYAYGDCELEYQIALPEFIRDAMPTKMVLMAEMATRRGEVATAQGAAQSTRAAKRKQPSSPPPLPKGEGGTPGRAEADSRRRPSHSHPGTVEIDVLGRTLWRLRLPDDPADSRGVLSHHRRFHHGSYGYLVRKMIDLTENNELRTALRERPSFSLVLRTGTDERGLSLYGRRLGRYMVDPTLIIQTAQDLSERPGWISVQPVTRHRLLDNARVVEGIRGTDAGGHEWRYTTDTPPPSWTEPEFDDSAWPTRRFTVPKLRGPVAIASPKMWLRTDVEINGRPIGMVLRYSHDEDTAIYLNGRQIVESTGHVADVVERPLRRDEVDLLRRGRNVIAAHTRQTRGGPGVDLQVQWIELTDREGNDAWPPVRNTGR